MILLAQQRLSRPADQEAPSRHDRPADLQVQEAPAVHVNPPALAAPQIPAAPQALAAQWALQTLADLPFPQAPAAQPVPQYQATPEFPAALAARVFPQLEQNLLNLQSPCHYRLCLMAELQAQEAHQVELVTRHWI